MKRNLILLACLIVAGVATGVALVATRGPSAALNAEKPEAATLPSAPAWELKDVEGKTVKSTDFAGKVVVLDFWATWCGPCRMEIPSFVELQNQYAREGLVVVGVSLDDDASAVVKPFMTKMRINYPVVMGDERMTDVFGGIEGIPTTFIIDRSGRIVTKHVGFAPKDVFERDIKALLAP